MKSRSNLKLIKGGKYPGLKPGYHVSSEELPIVELTEREKELVHFFPLFGKSHCSPLEDKLYGDSLTLDIIITKHNLDCIPIEEIEDRLTVRTWNCLRKSNIKIFITILMMRPDEILALKDMGRKTITELQKVGKYLLGIFE